MTEQLENAAYDKDSDYESMFGGSSDDDEDQLEQRNSQFQMKEKVRSTAQLAKNKPRPVIIDLVTIEKGRTSAGETICQGIQNKVISRPEHDDKIPITFNRSEKDNPSLNEMAIPRKRKHTIDRSKQNIGNSHNSSVRCGNQNTNFDSIISKTERKEEDATIISDKESILKRARARVVARQAQALSNINPSQLKQPSKFKSQVSKNHFNTNVKYNTNQFSAIDIDYFWKNLRNWNYIDDLNKYIRTQIPINPNEGNNCFETIGLQATDTVLHKDKRSKQTIPNRFHSSKEYKAIWAPLLIEETKSQMLSEISPLAPRLPQMLISVHVTPSRLGNENSDILTLNLSAHTSKDRKHTVIMTGKPINKIVGNNRTEFVTNDLVLLVPDTDIFEAACKGSQFLTKPASLLSYASPLVKDRFGAIGTVINRTKSVEGLMLSVSRRLWKRVEPSQMYLLRLNDSITALREFTALTKVGIIPLTKYLMADKIETNLEPLSSNDPLSDEVGPNILGAGFRRYVNGKFNASQKGAISAAAREYGDGGFTLVKGPPGTGKTTTLVALLNALHLRQYQRYYSEVERITINTRSTSSIETLAAIHAAAKVKPRILVCAPSNAAVDNVILKIMEDRFVDGNGGKYNPSIVRVGVGQSHKVARVSLKNQIETILNEGTSSSNLESIICNSRNELGRLQKEIENLQRRVRALAHASPYPLSRDWEIRIDEDNFGTTERVLFVNHKLQTVSLTCPPRPPLALQIYPTEEMPHYRSCMDSLVNYVERYNTLYSKLEQYLIIQNAAININNGNHNQGTIELNQQLETHILDSMHIVMTTLGSAGSKTIASAVKFEVVVVDEAAQSSEPSTLVALQLGSSHAILVGDPQQLPATIFSVSGRSTKYDRSLFQRLEEAGHPVHMLDTQYRMHPTISSFPRQIFYDGSLLDGHNVLHCNYGGQLSQLIRSRFQHFKPLTVFDLDSAEERGGVSLCNTDEAKLALHLFSSLDEETHGISTKSRVAIITPYSQQVNLLNQIFFEKYGEAYSSIVDISTVDAFQGKEAGIVIFSCVRGASKGVGIGFLSDVKRMNVALTRAKYYLFIIARCRTILVNPYWRDLVSHARKQQAIFKILTKKSESYTEDGKNNKSSIFSDLKDLLPLHPLNTFVSHGLSSDNRYNSDSDISA